MEQPTRPPAPTASVPARRVLFLCTHNSARSQIAEGLARSIAPEGAEVWSAGTSPGAVHPLAIEVMKEIGIDLSGHRSKKLDETPWREADTVVTLCAEAAESCPVIGGNVRRLHWPLPDPGRAPESERLTAFRTVRDELKWRVSSLWPGGD
ncbi:MAG TPA: arsenate reductase ArsC [Candidatus Udaeobacter sp.]|nr:arsenate reductase ArsC [Candidatus Udaeobacter sp.]